MRRKTSRRDTRFLITAGPTREFIDPVRFISNRSSGKMGYALAAAARRVSSRVTLVSGPTCLRAPRGVTLVNVVTAKDMAEAVFERFSKSDVVIMAAAVADFRARRIARSKIKKNKRGLEIRLARTVDILARLGRRKRRQFLVGFAAETESVERNAANKLRAKRLDLIVANDVTLPGAGFDSDTNKVVILGADGSRRATGRAPKSVIARLIVRECMEGFAGR